MSFKVWEQLNLLWDHGGARARRDARHLIRMIRRQDKGEPLWPRIAGDAEQLWREVRLIATEDATRDRRIAQVWVDPGEDRKLTNGISNLLFCAAPRLIFVRASVRVELRSCWSWQRIPARAVAAHAADPLNGAANLYCKWRRRVARLFALHQHATETIKCSAATTLRARPGATEQIRLGGAVALQSCHCGGVDEHLPRIVAM